MSSRIQFTLEDWERIKCDYSAWWAGELDRPLIYLVGQEENPSQGLPQIHHFLANYPPRVSAEAICHDFDQHFRTQCYYADAYPFWFINFGAGILAGFVGGEVVARPDTVWFQAAAPSEMKDLKPRFDPDSYWWQRVVDVTRTACQYWQGLVAISHTDLGGTLDILASLRTTEGLLTDLIDAPEEVERANWEISEIWKECYHQLTDIIAAHCPGTVPWARSWSARRTYMLQCDFCYMLSPAMFARFVLPELESCCDLLEDAFYHLDGIGALPHLDTLLGIESLKGIQWVPGAGQPSAQDWLEVLGRIRSAGKLCQVSVSPEGALRISRELGGKGFQFIISQDMTPAEAHSFIKEMARADRNLKQARIIRHAATPRVNAEKDLPDT